MNNHPPGVVTRHIVLDIKRPYEKLFGRSDPDYVRQDGITFAWSESNCWYEMAWWLYAPQDKPLVRANLERYPWYGEPLPLGGPQRNPPPPLEDTGGISAPPDKKKNWAARLLEIVTL